VLFFLATWPIFAMSCFLLGAALLRRLGQQEKRYVSADREDLFPEDYVMGAVWLGLAVMGALFSAVALFLPLSLMVSLILIGVPFFLLAFATHRRRLIDCFRAVFHGASGDTAFIVLGGGALCATAYVAAAQFTLFDTAYYHLPLARVLNEFGSIVGLTLLHTNLGQTSSWFALAAASTSGGEYGWGASTANGYVAAMAMFHALLAWRRCGAKDGRAADYIVAIGYPVVLMMAARWGMVSSLSPDFPVMLLCVNVAWALSLPGERRLPADLGLIVALLTAAFAFSIKISSAPLVFISGLAVLIGFFGQRTQLLRLIAISLVLITPAILLSIMSSGCLAYPVAMTCLDLSWTPDAEDLRAYVERIMTAATGIGPGTADQYRFAERLTIWIGNDLSGGIIATASIVAFASIAVVEIFLRGSRAGAARLPVWSLGSIGIGLVYVLATAPAGRFIGGFAAALIGLLCWRLLQLASIPIGSRVRTFALMFTVAGLIFIHHSGPAAQARHHVDLGVKESVFPDPGRGFLFPKRIVPYDIHHPERQRLRITRSAMSHFPDVLIPDGKGECWAAAPPCSPLLWGSNVRYRNAERGGAGGFERVFAQEN